MSRTIGRFDYRVLKMRGKDQLPFKPIVQIILDNWSSDKPGSPPIISPHLMTPAEVDEYIARPLVLWRRWKQGPSFRQESATILTEAIPPALYRPTT